MARLVLYHTQGCHLCELAYKLITDTVAPKDIVKLDIMSDEALIAKYQTSIPVLCDRQEKELFWPFDSAQLARFLAS